MASDKQAFKTLPAQVGSERTSLDKALATSQISVTWSKAVGKGRFSELFLARCPISDDRPATSLGVLIVKELDLKGQALKPSESRPTQSAGSNKATPTVSNKSKSLDENDKSS